MTRIRMAYSRPDRTVGWCLLGLCSLALVLLSCGGGGESGQLVPSADRNLQLEQQAVRELLGLYRTALLQEDVDRLQELFDRETAASLLAPFQETLRALAITDVVLSDIVVQEGTSFFSVSFQQALSVRVPGLLEQRTRMSRTIWQVRPMPVTRGVVRLVIASITQEGPEFLVTTPGQLHEGVRARIEVSETTGGFPLVGGEVVTPEDGERALLLGRGGRLQGSFMPSVASHPAFVELRVHGADGTDVVVPHRYQVRRDGEGVVERIALVPTEAGPSPCFFAVAVAPHDGTVWGGANGGNAAGACLPDAAAVGGARVYQVQPGASREAVSRAALAEDAGGRVEDIVVDQLGRLHFLVRAEALSRDVVLDQGVYCATVNAFDPRYPLQVADPMTGGLVPSPSTRAVAAGDGDLWVFGTEAGASRVTDTFRQGYCPDAGVEVRYAPVVQRQPEGLLSNQVQAMVVGSDGTLWFGTAFGLTRLQQERFTPVPFAPELSLRGDVGTLEAFFQEVARAIFDARPLTTVALGGVSFVERFGSPLVKADLISSAVEDGLGRVWVGTYGGGLRMIENRQPAPVDARLLTRQDGLGSNLIASLALAPDGSVWAATQKGVSRIHTGSDIASVTHFSFLDGLPLGVRDVAVDAAGTAWLATDDGLFRIVPRGGNVDGMVQDTAGQPVAGVEVLVLDTPFRTVTDATGYFVLRDVPSGVQQLVFDGSTAPGEALLSAHQSVELGAGSQTSVSVRLPSQVSPPQEPSPRVPQLTVVTGHNVRATLHTPVPLVVRLTDSLGTPLTATVTFQLLDPERGTLVAERVTPDATGVAQTSVTVTREGTLRVVARVEAVETLLTVTGIAQGSELRLVQVSGNRQSGQPGERLPAPLVVRLQDLFGNPVIGGITAVLRRGEGVFFTSSLPQNLVALATAGDTARVTTNVQGEAQFTLQVGGRDADMVVAMSVTAFPEVPPVQFLAVVGAVDTPDIPLDVAVRDTMLLVADRRSGLQRIDVSDPTAPQRLEPVNLDGTEVRLALDGARTYVATNSPVRLYILDDNLQTLGRVHFPTFLQRQSITGVTVQEQVVYLVTESRLTNAGTLQVIDSTRLQGCSEPPDEGVPIAGGRPRGLAVTGRMAYVPAAEAGLLVYDIATVPPTLVSTLAGTFVSEITLAHGRAYVIEATASGEQRFTVLDLSTPQAPTRLGFTPIPRVTQVAEVATSIAVDERFAYLARFASGLEVVAIEDPRHPQRLGVIDTPSQALHVTVDGEFLYVSDQIFGIQVLPRPAPETLLPMGTEARPAPLPFPQESRTLVVAASAVSNTGNGTAETPYRALSDAFQAVRLAVQAGQVAPDEPLTVQIRQGTYAPLTTGEVFPLDLSGLPPLTLQSTAPDNPEVVQATVIDAAFTGDVFFLDTAASMPVRIEGLTLMHGAHGLFIRGAAGVTLRQNRIVEHVFAGLSLGSSARLPHMIAANLIERNGQEGVSLSQVGTVTEVADNVVRDNGGGGFFLEANATVTLRHNTIVCNGNDGIRLRDTSDAVIMENLISANGSLALELLEIPLICPFLGSSAGGCTSVGHGIAAVDSTLNIVANTIENNRRDGIFQQNTTVTVVDNTVAKNRMHGLNMEQGQAVIHGNTMTDQREDDGLSLRQVTAEITENDMSRNADHGIELTDATAATVTNNLLADNHQRGLEISERSTATVTHNIITDNAGDGVLVMRAVADLAHNTIQGNNDGVVLRGDSRARATATLHAHACICDNRENGIDAMFADVIMTDNTVTGNAADGVILSRATAATVSGGRIAQNAGNGILLNVASRGRIGCDGRTVTIAQHSGAGIVVQDSRSLLERGDILFEDNLGGDIVGAFGACNP